MRELLDKNILRDLLKTILMWERSNVEYQSNT